MYKKKGGVKDGITFFNRSVPIVHICWSDNFGVGRTHSDKKGDQINKQVLILALVLLAGGIISPAISFAFSPCVQDTALGGYYCDINNQIYATYSACFEACYASFEGSDVKLHVSRSVIELFYMVTGALMGVFLIVSIMVGLR